MISYKYSGARVRVRVRLRIGVQIGKFCILVLCLGSHDERPSNILGRVPVFVTCTFFCARILHLVRGFLRDNMQKALFLFVLGF